MKKNEVRVIGVSRFDFKDRQTGKDIQGTKVHFHTLDPVENSDVKGVIPQTANVPLSHYELFTTVPGVYLMDVSVSVQGSKPRLVVEGFTYLREK